MNKTEQKVQKIKLFALDFDGVFTDNRVFIDEDGREAVVCDRSDSLGLKMLKEKRPDIKVIVISKETNNVVKTRCKKLNIACRTGSMTNSSCSKRSSLRRTWTPDRSPTWVMISTTSSVSLTRVSVLRLPTPIPGYWRLRIILQRKTAAGVRSGKSLILF